MNKYFNNKSLLFKFLFAGIGTLLLISSIWFVFGYYNLNQSLVANQIRGHSNQISIHLLDARRAEKDFLLRSLTDPEFFKTGKRKYLDKFNTTIDYLFAETKVL